jgi:hypothetical protein
METKIRYRAPVVAALFSALDAYADWIFELAGPSGFAGGDTSIARNELQKVLDIRSTSFPHVTREATEILVGQSEIANLLYERQLRALSGATSGDVDDRNRCAGLLQRQLAAIELLRRVVAPSESVHAGDPGAIVTRESVLAHPVVTCEDELDTFNQQRGT